MFPSVRDGAPMNSEFGEELMSNRDLSIREHWIRCMPVSNTYHRRLTAAVTFAREGSVRVWRNSVRE